ncbi:MAG: hypothetical protein ACYDC6_10660 [Acidobacteriaceae bacterium]
MRKVRLVGHPYLHAPRKAHRADWSGFSSCLFVLLLAVFTWALHHRVAQYEHMRPVGSHLPAAKMCLTERNRMSLPSLASVDGPEADGSIVFFLAFLFARVSRRLTGPMAEMLRRSKPLAGTGTRRNPCLNYFFFLPPPFHLSA